MGSMPAANLILSDTPNHGASAEHCRFVQRVRRRYAAERVLFATQCDGAPDRAALQALIDRLLADGRALPAALRVARQLVLERLAVLDAEQAAPLALVTTTMTLLAEVTLDRALTEAFALADTRFGAPSQADGRRPGFWVLGMGKLGARELNVSSDIDLIYVYEEDGSTSGGSYGSVSNHEYFSLVARHL
ncbi:MAG: hypothetical protein RLZZ598_1398, partial [Pseudomonadota bacterium]